MPFDFNAFILLAAATTAVIVAAIFLFAWLGRRVRAHNTYVGLHAARGPMRVVDEDDELDDADIDELMDHAAGLDPVEVNYLTPFEWDAAVQRGLDELGCTYEELAAMAVTRDFATLEHRKLWMVARQPEVRITRPDGER